VPRNGTELNIWLPDIVVNNPVQVSAEFCFPFPPQELCTSFIYISVKHSSVSSTPPQQATRNNETYSKYLFLRTLSGALHNEYICLQTFWISRCALTGIPSVQKCASFSPTNVLLLTTASLSLLLIHFALLFIFRQQ
jgi:hypothetical protein